jgi:hypothetical protein
MRLLCELLQENECSDISESICSNDSEVNVKISSCGEHSVSSDEEEHVSDNNSMLHGIWAKSGAQQPHLPFFFCLSVWGGPESLGIFVSSP